MASEPQTTDHAGNLRAAADYLGGTYDGLDDELRAAAAEIERLEEAVWRIAQWADAYPYEVFPEVDAEYHSRARKVLEADGMTLDRLSASAMRHVVQGVGKIAKEALSR